MRKIMVNPGYTVLPKYLELEDNEEVCERCKGKGEIIMIFGYPHNTHMACPGCSGSGKVWRCKVCNRLQPWSIIKHDKDKEWMDGLCLPCIAKGLYERGELTEPQYHALAGINLFGKKDSEESTT